MKTILVTGGAGYIGSHTCKALAQAGYLPVTLDNLSRGHESAVRWGPLERCDIADEVGVQDIVARHQPIAVIHFAAYGYVGESTADPSLYYGNNVSNSYRFLEALRANGTIKHVVFSSSCASYGITRSTPIDETQPQAPISPYGFSKLAVERMLADYGAAYGFSGLSLRYFNAAGADIDGELGEDHDPEPHFIPTALAVASGRQPHLQINGIDFDTPDGSCIRDFVHVNDLAEGHLRALELLLSGQARRPAYNLGTGTGHSLLQVVEAIRRITGRRLEVQTGPRRIGDPPFAVANPALAAAELGWRCQHSSLDQIIDTAWRWMQRSETPK